MVKGYWRIHPNWQEGSWNLRQMFQAGGEAKIQTAVGLGIKGK